jgi:hypothetical protein
MDNIIEEGRKPFGFFSEVLEQRLEMRKARVALIERFGFMLEGRSGRGVNRPASIVRAQQASKLERLHQQEKTYYVVNH